MPSVARPVGELLHVVTSTDRRGAQLFGVELSSSLEARGWSSRAVALTQGTGDHKLDIDVLGNRRFGARTLRQLRVHSRKAAVVIAHGSSTLPAYVLSRPSGTPPFVYRSVGDTAYWTADGTRRRRVSFYLSRARAVVALTRASADSILQVHGLPGDRVHVIAQGVAAERFPAVDERRRVAARRSLGLREEGQVVVYVGALSSEKRVEDAITAVAPLPEIEMIVAGDGPERRSLELLASEVAPGRVHFAGTVADVASVLAAADVLVLPSATEGLPAVLIEAGLTGLPVVATDVGWVREIVVDGETGVVVPSHARPALQGALDRVLRDPGDLGERARARCLERFEMDTVAGQWNELLTAVAAR